jgi:recombinational DNA repair protein RecR
MNKSKMSVILLSIGLLASACTFSEGNRAMTVSVKKLVEPDLFGVLSNANQEILFYKNSKEIEGEYLVLASVEIQNVSDDESSEIWIEKLKQESKEVGGNGVLFIKEDESEGDLATHKIKAMVVYALDRMPKPAHLASL